MRAQAITCAFTGHRPEKLPWGENEQDSRCQALQERIADAVEQAYLAGFRHFVCGMARGCDTWFAQAVLSLKERWHDVTLEAAVPCADQAQRWPQADRRRYDAMLAECDQRTVLYDHYVPGCMQQRNRYMVDHCDLLLAVHDGVSGGTQSTLTYAFSHQINVVILPLVVEKVDTPCYNTPQIDIKEYTEL